MSEGYLWPPVTMSLPFGRPSEVPSTFQSLTSVTEISVGTGWLSNFAASSLFARSAYDSERLDAAWTTVPLRTSHVLDSTDHVREANSIRSCRAAAAPSRTAGTVRGEVPLPAVI